ncbi:MAG: hypothetical protein RIA64_01460 [Rhodospirillales bacterium]
MHSDVKSIEKTASATAVSGEHRLKGVYLVPSASAGTLIVKDGGSSGTTMLTLKTVASATADPVFVPIPCNGIRFMTDIYLDITDVASVTVFWD